LSSLCICGISISVTLKAVKPCYHCTPVSFLQCFDAVDSATGMVSCWLTRSSAIAVIADCTACSILTLFIVTGTSRPLNKKIRLLSVRGSNDYCGSASAVCTPLSAPAVGGKACAINSTGLGRRSHRVTVQRHRVIVDKRADSPPESH